MKKITYGFLAIGVMILTSCGSTAPCGLAKAEKKKNEQIKTPKEFILEADAAIK